MTTLTREALLEKAKPRYEEVDVPGIGLVGIRSVSELRQSQRDARNVTEDGKFIDNYFERARAMAFVDQLMADHDTPLFSEDDIPAILEMDKAIVRPLFAAVQKFNGEGPAQKKGELPPTDESSSETTD